MVSLQIISKVINTNDLSIIENNLLTEDYFEGYKEEYNYIIKHYKDYGNVPDKVTFLSKFPDIELVDVTETDRYLIDTIREEYLYYRSVPVVQKVAELLKTDANAASEYMIHAMKDLQPNYNLGGVDIVADAQNRYEQFKSRKENQKDWYFTSGFEELDDLIHGISRVEELIVLFARINQGKSWVLEKICTHIWQLGFNVGYVSPEMSANSIGYRFDTLYKNFSNKGLMWGNNDVENTEYKDYIDNLAQEKHKFIVATPNDFDKKITITKLRNWVKENKFDVIAIDGITYLSDERAKRGDTKSTMLTNISEDLMLLSMELEIPVLVVVQANRSGVMDKGSEDVPELENIKDSDGIGANASKAFSIRQTKEGILTLQIKKQRFGPVGGKLHYAWDINTGEFKFLPTDTDAQPTEVTRKRLNDTKKKLQTKEDVF